MIVIGADTHKRTHTLAAVLAGSGRIAGELTASAREPGYREMLAWGRTLDAERVWAIEDCRHVSAGLERFLVDSGERVVRVPPKLMGASRVGERAAGKSDPIDALAIARAALREGPETLPVAHLDESAMQIKLLLDHREDLVKARSETSAVCAGTSTPSGRNSRSPPGASTGSSGSTASTGSSPAPSRARG